MRAYVGSWASVSKFMPLLVIVFGLLSACGPDSTQVDTPVILAATPSSVPSSESSSDAAAATALVLDSSVSKASYHAQEQLVGRSLPSQAVGTSGAVSGSIMLADDGSILTDQSQITVDLRQLKSDESRRDNFIQGSTLQTGRYPTATFVPKQAAGLDNPLPTSGSASFQLSGDLTVHGVTKPVTWQVSGQFDPDTVGGTATTQVNISDFGMTPPKAGPVLNIQDGITLQLDFQAQRQSTELSGGRHT